MATTHCHPIHKYFVWTSCVICVIVMSSTKLVNSDIIKDTNRTCVDLYHDGMTAYLDERWQDCIDLMETSMSVYKAYRKDIINCRMQCTKEADDAKPFSVQDIEDLHFFERTLRNTLCLIKCRKKRKATNTLPFDGAKYFEELKPYDYLQLCYFQKNMIQQAANSAFTFLVVNPNHSTMLSNLKFYSSLPEVDVKDIINYEAANYVSLYVHGTESYTTEDYTSVINYFEESLLEYIRAEEECRAYCEGAFDQGWFPDFIPSIANHFTFCLKCKQRCANTLNSLNGEIHDDILPSHYHYLQFAYYKVGNLKEASKAAMSYLLFYPVDETMLENLDYYKTLPKSKKEYLKPREEAVQYIQRQHYEMQLLDYINSEFTLEDEKEEEENENMIDSNLKVIHELKDYPHNHSIKTPKNTKPLVLLPPPIVKLVEPSYYSKLHSNTDSQKGFKMSEFSKNNSQIRFVDDKKSQKEKFVKTLLKNKIQVIKGEKELKGKHRFLADGFAEGHECNELLQLAQVAAVQGDGYSGKKSPHTEKEKFEGVTLGRVALLVYFGLMEPEVLELYLDISDRGKNFVERYFRIPNKLYFTFTHLVCRSAIAGLDRNATDFSHAVHADNCNVQKNGDCTFEPPAYTWRSYSAILYLNDDFEGGEFIFASDAFATKIQSTVQPKCGRLVGFSAGSENLHGVNAVRRGRRCALALWFTFDAKYDEVERYLAQQVLNQVKKKGSISEQLIKELKKHVPSNTFSDIKHN